MTLDDFIPIAHDRGWLSDRVKRYLNLKVVAVYQSTDRDKDDFAFWLGRGQNVFHWALLENGMGVGFNESPSWGWAFYVLSKRKTANALELSKGYKNA